MNTQYYVKKGKRYIPYNDPGALDGLSNGIWLVVVKPNSTSCRSKLNAKYAEIDGALEYLHEGLCAAMMKKSEIRPRAIKMSKKEIKAWAAYKKIIGRDIPTYFEYASYSDIADSACKYIKKILIENNCDISKIKRKYEIKRKQMDAISSLEIE